MDSEFFRAPSCDDYELCHSSHMWHGGEEKALHVIYSTDVSSQKQRYLSTHQLHSGIKFRNDFVNLTLPSALSGAFTQRRRWTGRCRPRRRRLPST